MKNICENCEHWYQSATYSAVKSDGYRYLEKISERGTCQRFKFDETAAALDEVFAPMASYPGHGATYFDPPSCGPKFGCIHFMQVVSNNRPKFKIKD